MSSGPGFAHLVTVGTSVLKNARDAVKACAEGGECPDGVDAEAARRALEELNPCVPGLSFDDVECSRRLTKASTGYRLAGELLRRRPELMSSELNAMKLFMDLDGGSCRPRLVDRVVLYCTDTYAGEAAASLLAGYFSGSCGLSGRVELRRISGLGRQDPVEFVRGLYNLLKAVCEDSERLRRDGYLVLLNLTGGLKPEAGFALLAAAMARGRIGVAYYIHDAFRETAIIPVPQVSRVSGEALKDELERLMNGLRRGSVRLDSVPDELLWLAYLLSASGIAKIYPAAREGGAGGASLAPILAVTGDLSRVYRQLDYIKNEAEKLVELVSRRDC